MFSNISCRSIMGSALKAVWQATWANSSTLMSTLSLNKRSLQEALRVRLSQRLLKQRCRNRMHGWPTVFVQAQCIMLEMSYIVVSSPCSFA